MGGAASTPGRSLTTRGVRPRETERPGRHIIHVNPSTAAETRIAAHRPRRNVGIGDGQDSSLDCRERLRPAAERGCGSLGGAAPAIMRSSSAATSKPMRRVSGSSAGAWSGSARSHRTSSLSTPTSATCSGVRPVDVVAAGGVEDLLATNIVAGHDSHGLGQGAEPPDQLGIAMKAGRPPFRGLPPARPPTGPD